MIFLKGFLMFIWIYAAYIAIYNNLIVIFNFGKVKNHKKQEILEIIALLFFVIWYYL
jgi:hypothetical protein